MDMEEQTNHVKDVRETLDKATPFMIAEGLRLLGQTLWDRTDGNKEKDKSNS